jgi:dTDP-4-amino-4,6-dideoxygalactose transaminase
MSQHGMSRDAWKRYSNEGSWFYEVLAPGFKYNLTDIAAAIGLHQLARREELHRKRSAVAERYDAAFSQISELDPPPSPTHVQHARHLYPLRLQPEHLDITRSQFIDLLGKANIGTSVHFIPLHLHPYYRDTFHLAPEDFPAALASYEREISLPMFSTMADDDVDDVIAAVSRLVYEHRC